MVTLVERRGPLPALSRVKFHTGVDTTTLLGTVTSSPRMVTTLVERSPTSLTTPSTSPKRT